MKGYKQLNRQRFDSIKKIFEIDGNIRPSQVARAVGVSPATAGYIKRAESFDDYKRILRDRKIKFAPKVKEVFYRDEKDAEVKVEAIDSLIMKVDALNENVIQMKKLLVDLTNSQKAARNGIDMDSVKRFFNK